MSHLHVFLLLLIYAIEPYLWVKSVSLSETGFHNCYKKYFAMLGYYFISFWKQFLAFRHADNIWIVMLSLLLMCYMFTVTIIFAKGELHIKVMSCSFFCLVTCISELVTIFFCASCLHISAGELLKFGRMNLVCTFIAKVFLYVLCRGLFFGEDNRIMAILYEKYELLVLIVLNFILEILTTSVLRNDIMRITVSMNMLFFGVQIMLIGNFLYILYILRRKDRKLAEANKELERLYHVVRVTERLKEVQHDVKVHATVLASLLEDENYCEAKRYLSDIAWDIKQVKKMSSVSDRALALVLSQFVQESEVKGIQFYRHILVQDFYISSRDLCLMVSNMLQNAKEATERLIQEKRYISLDIFPVEGGYRITCMNPYGEKNVCYKTTKRDRESHGLGLKIIKVAAERNGGAMEIIPNQIRWFEITCFIPVPRH